MENIFSHNLTGIDLDTRAKQLSQFALLLKACQKDAAFADAHCMPNVLTMPKPWNEETQGPIQDMLHIYFQGEATNGQKEDIIDCFDLMQDADSLGSIMKFDISESTRLLIKQTTDYWCNQEIVPEEVRTQILAFKMILALTEKYHALVMNPPYMGGSKMNSILSKYVKDNYEESKADLFSVFMQMGMKRLIFNGKMAQINMQSWMFLSSFEKLRTQLLKNYNIDNMLHLGPRTFDELSGEVVQNTAFVLSKHKPTEQGGVYFRLVEGKNCADKEQLFLSHINGNEDGNRIYYPNVEQKNFEKIPGAPIGYWVSPKIQEIFTSNLALSAVCSPTQGLATADNARFLRLWFEPSYSRIGFGCENAALAARSQKKWFPCNKGGGQRKWYGNQSEVIDWENDGEAIKNFPGAVIRNEHCYFKESVTWNMISSGNLSFRFFPKGSILNNASNAICEGDLSGLLGYLNSPITIKIANLINPTLNLSNGVVAKFPYLNVNTETYRNIVKQNVAISKSDWDAHETSWDFQRNELLSIDTSTYTANIDYKIEKHFEETGERINLSPAAPKLGSLEWRMEQYKTKWERKFMQLHKNEEELNRQFIDIYGLQDELTPDVQLSEITILQQGEIKITDQYSLCDNDGSIFTDSDGAILTVTGDSYLEWQDDVIMKQLISYAVGCMLGRYRLDKPGLHIAHPNPTDDEIAPYEYKGEQWEIDDDGIMPLMPNDCGFSDNASARFADFIRVALGNEDHVANLNYVEQCLGKTLEQYFVKDFWKDHKKMYQNRPIYWLFSSKKGAFQVIAYMHRMNAYTAERVRSKYLLPYIEHLEAEIDKLDARRAELSTKETKQLQALQKQLDECREYHERLQVVAEQAISFDLDDGVVVNYAKFGDILQKIK